MTNYDATEQAFKNGYEKGYAEAKEQFEPKTAKWIFSEMKIQEGSYGANMYFPIYICSNCSVDYTDNWGYEDLGDPKKIKPQLYCPHCGARMIEVSE